MAIRLFNAARVGDELAAGSIGAQAQSRYLTASFLIWVIPAYLFLFPAPRTDDAAFFWTVWLVELAIVVFSCILGIAYCLRNCRVDPAKNFLVDFSCLNAPVSLTTLLIVWAAYYLLEGALIYADVVSTRVYDVVRLLASSAAVLIVFLRIGRHMKRVSQLRKPAGR
jgi:hypothetical protein